MWSKKTRLNDNRDMTDRVLIQGELCDHQEFTCYESAKLGDIYLDGK